MESNNKKFEESQKSESKGAAISKGQKFVKLTGEKPVSAEEKAFYALSKNRGKTFISKNRIY